LKKIWLCILQFVLIPLQAATIERVANPINSLRILDIIQISTVNKQLLWLSVWNVSFSCRRIVVVECKSKIWMTLDLLSPTRKNHMALDPKKVYNLCSIVNNVSTFVFRWLGQPHFTLAFIFSYYVINVCND